MHRAKSNLDTLKLREVLGDPLYWRGERHVPGAKYGIDPYWEDVPESEAPYCEVGGFSRKTSRHDGVSWYSPALLAFGDYVGDALTESNQRAFLSLFPESPGRIVVDTGAYGYQCVYIRVTALRDRDLREALIGLADYPVLENTGSELYEVESEYEDAAWDSYVRDEVRAARCTAESGDIGYSGCGECEACSLPDAELREVFEVDREAAGEDWREHTGGSAWIDVDRIYPDAAERREQYKRDESERVAVANRRLDNDRILYGMHDRGRFIEPWHNGRDLSYPA